MDAEVISANVAFSPEDVEAMARAAGWRSVEIPFGRWSGRSGLTLDFQDLVLLRA